MASVALTSLTATMKLEFLQPNNPRVSLDDEASISINSLFENLSSLQAFVQEKSGGGPATRDLEMKIRDFALEAEDRIEIQLSNFLLAKNAEDQQKASQKLHQILREAAENARELLKLSSSISKEAVKNESEGPLIPWIKHSPGMLEGGRMVGRQRDHTLIVDKLIPDDHFILSRRFKVITILGMTGIGKTTLATSVYNDPKVVSRFDVRGWVTMSCEYNKTQMLHDLLWTLTKEPNIPDNDGVAATQVYNFLRGKRFLIVVDNLCNTQAWYDIRRCLPDEYGKTLVVSSKESQLGTPTIHLPSTIWESPQLRHLELDKSYVIDPPNMDKDNMQTLFWVCPTHCRTGVHCRFPNIKDLKIFVPGGNPITLDNLEYLERLEMLTISVLLGQVLTLPKPFVFPLQLRKLSLNGINLSESNLTVMGMLPFLGVLKLKNVFYGKVWEVEARRFPQLQFLLLEDKTLKQWRVDKYSFHLIERLVLRFCYCLKKIPLSMENTMFLKSIEFQQCCPSVVTSAEDIQHRIYRTRIFEVRIDAIFRLEAA
ncbi:PREDICTED: putative late blight resistance protein homolog R1A-10 [Ipomoea nil]|uniref:putative late blight resistance protein homolog R1A-10 n=1 Tax=Ipomoea nil TaxID=35883 RepID=UPI000901D3EB|nr:PREDICTED: putative late blight resistance protein homolog R1A-10 [Ipomoea nil]